MTVFIIKPDSVVPATSSRRRQSLVNAKVITAAQYQLGGVILGDAQSILTLAHISYNAYLMKLLRVTSIKIVRNSLLLL